MIFGDKKIFAIEYLGISGGLEVVNIYVSGKNVTINDNSHYKLASSLSYEASNFLNRLHECQHLNELPEGSIDERFSYIYQNELRFSCQVFDWGPPTQDYFFVVFPFDSKFYLYGTTGNINETLGIEIKPDQIVSVIQAAEQYISNQSV